MKYTILILLSACFTCYVSCASNPRPIQDTIRFYYDPTMHYFVAVNSADCFLVPLTREEQDHVHSSYGMEDLELTMMREWIGKLNEVKKYHDDPSLPQDVLKWCANRDMFFLDRNVPMPSTKASPLAG